MLISPETIAAVRSAADIADVIGDHVPLKKSGTGLRGACPFHGGTNRTALQVSPDKGVYFCHSCGATGDVIQFVIDHDSLPFAEAVEYLAARYQVPIAVADPVKQAEYEQKQTERDLLLGVMWLSARYYANWLFLPEGKHARDYAMGQRGLTLETLQKFKMGFAPKGWDTLYKFLVEQRQIPVELVESAGLIVPNKDQSGYHDRFRDRLIVPICNVRGQVIGLGGRSLDGAKPKYLNSPETAIFVKSDVLFGMDHAKDAIAKKDRGIVVEGYLDAIALHHVGVCEVVATMGTAVNGVQLRQLAKRTQSKRVILNFDNDDAGLKATMRAVEALGDSALDAVQLRIMTLPDGSKDPDDYLRHHTVAEYQALADQALLYLDWEMQRALANHDLSQPDQFTVVSEALANLISRIDAGSPLRTHYLHQAAQVLGQGKPSLTVTVEKDLARRISHQRWYGNQDKVTNLVASRVSPLHLAEEQVLQIFLQVPELRGPIFAMIAEAKLQFSRDDFAGLWRIVVSQGEDYLSVSDDQFLAILRAACGDDPVLNNLCYYLLNQPELPRGLVVARVAVAKMRVIQSEALLEQWAEKIKAAGKDFALVKQMYGEFVAAKQAVQDAKKALSQADQEPVAALDDEIF